MKFSQQDLWLGEVGFEVIEGHDAPEFESWPTSYHFEAPHDFALYKKALHKIKTSSVESPYLMVLSTMSSHQPFLSPDGSEDSEENVMRYVDR